MSDRYIVPVIHGRHINPDRIHGMGRQTKHEQGEASVLDTAYCATNRSPATTHAK